MYYARAARGDKVKATDFLLDFLAVGLLIIALLLPGAILAYPIFPKFLKKGRLLLNIIIWAILGYITYHIVLDLHPIILPLALFLAGVLKHFFSSRPRDPKRLWRDIFRSNALITAVIWALIFLIPTYTSQSREIFLGMEFYIRTPQSIAMTNMKTIATIEKAYYSELHTFTDQFYDLGWTPQDRNQRYSYYFSADFRPGTLIKTTDKMSYNLDPWEFSIGTYPKLDTPPFIRYRKKFIIRSEEQILKEVASKYGIGVSADNFTAVAIGNIDNDPDWDVWIVNKNGKPSNIMNDKGYAPDKVILNLWIAEYYDDGFVIFPDRLNELLFVLNLILWIIFSWLVWKADHEKVVATSSGQPI